MSTLDPRIIAQLEAFACRRRRLLLLRGVCSTVAMLVGAMMLVALVDWLFVLPDEVRWALSGAAYLSVLVVAWLTCGRPLLQVLDARRLALLIEGAEPALREELLSAVELGQGTGEWDSAQFRALVQADVSQRVEGLRMERLLPAVLLRSALVGLAAVVALCLVALFWPSLRFGALLARALLPGANLERVSAVQVRIIQPSPVEGPVAQGDTVPLLVEISGRRVTSALLETFTKGGGRSVLALQPAANGRFSAGIQVAREDVEYRVRAFDAITRKYRLQASARPSVVRFQKKFRFPTYTGLPPKEATEESGDFSALEGTQVELAIQPDQPVQRATLSLEVDHQTRAVELKPRGDGWLSATFPLEKSFIYRVELVAAATGFENKFSPEYEARAVPDLIPEMTLEVPQRDLVASANEILPLAGTAKDDIALARVEQQVRINQGRWIARPLSTAKAVEVKIDERWDLFQQGVHPGDSISTKLVGIDCKGGRGESRAVTITIAAAGFERRREEALAAQRALLKEIAAWQKSAEGLEKTYCERLRKTYDNAGAEPAVRQAALTEFSTAEEDCQTHGVAVQTQLAATLRLAAAGHETANLALLSRLASRSQSGLRFLPYELAGAGAEPLPETARALVRDVEGICASIARRGKVLEDLGSRLLLSEEIDVATENVQVMAREQENLSTLAQGSGADARRWEQIAARQKVVLAEAAATEEGMKGAYGHAFAGVGDRMKRLARALGDQRAALAVTLAAGAPSRELLAPVLNLARTTRETWQGALEMKRDYGPHPQSAVQQLYEQTEASWTGFEKLKQEVEDVIRADKFPVEQRGQLAGGRWEARTLLWKTYGDVEELRPDADSIFVHDLRAVQLALEANRQELVTPGAPPTREPGWKRLESVDQALRVLESAHELTQLATGLEGLAVAERYQAGALHARTSNFTDWYRLEQRVRAADNDISRTNVADKGTRKILEEVKRLVRALPGDSATRAIQEEMPRRMKREYEPVEQTAAAERLALLVRQALELLREPAEQAREAIAAAAPKLPERLAQLAQEAKALQAATQEKAEQAASKAPEQGKAEAREHLAQQQGLNQKLETLKDAIRAEANLQNMMEKEGREKARDADDALAMLKEPPVRAEQALAEAAQADRAAEQKGALESASHEEGKLAKALEQLAQHYDAMEKGEEEKSRMALRDAEKDLGVQKQLDEQYAKAEALAKAAESSPEGMLKKLEQALAQNPLMRQELSGVSHELLSDANQKLAAASKQESAVARELEKLAAASPAPPKPQSANAPPATPTPTPSATAPEAAPAGAKPAGLDAAKDPKAGEAAAKNPAESGQPKPGETSTPPAAAASEGAKPPGAAGDNKEAAPSSPTSAPAPAAPNPQLAGAAEQQKPIGKNAAEAGQAVERAGRHEERLQNKATGQQLQKLGAEVQATAATEVPKAAQALNAAQAAAEATPAVQAAERGLKEKLAQLGEAQAPSSPAPETPASPAAGMTPESGLPSPASTQAQDQATAQAQAQAAPTPGQPAQAPAQAMGQTPAASAPGIPAQAQASPAASPSAPAPASANAQSSPASVPAPGAAHAPATASSAPPAANAPAAGTPPLAPELASLMSPPGSDPGGAPEIPSGPAPAQQQVWMARALDALDAALHEGQANGQPDGQQKGQGKTAQSDQGKGEGQPEQGKPGQGEKPAAGQGKSPSNSMQQAQKAMAAAGQAQAAEMRANRSSPTPGQPSDATKESMMAKSDTGAQVGAGDGARGTLPGLGKDGVANNNWGKLPKQVAEQLTQGQRENVSAEYQKEVETYYRVIAERARKTP